MYAPVSEKGTVIIEEKHVYQLYTKLY